MDAIRYRVGFGDVAHAAMLTFGGEPLEVVSFEVLTQPSPMLHWLIVSPRSVTLMRAEADVATGLVLRDDAKLIGPLKSAARAFRRARRSRS